ncbi:FadR/GntR family transcriptional regulator [Maridesulfovibrio bastinii]|jgi:GntR family transcriptional repressor for pyruvate dehydrogenase complex|uniref:FadR/GntR family transcriptional regulator n=1 Tax=Maridesulfovibrio bastinii TaxID=47157 RepID=UPI00040832BD|nr:FadR/GntR family transcriptional regulator [Maridesulfovibrio bastinii]
MLTPIKKARISETAAIQLEELIRGGTFKEGENLPSERKLMKELQVGRGSVREALRILEIKGYIETKPGIGAFVKSIEGDILSPLSPWLMDNKEAIHHFFEVRYLLEPSAAGFAASRITPETIEALKKNLEEFRTAAEQNDLTRAILSDAEFHRLIGKATGNKVLTSIMDTLHRTMIEGWKASLKVPHRIEKSLREHTEILKTIENGDEKTASKLMREHLSLALDDLEEHGL